MVAEVGIDEKEGNRGLQLGMVWRALRASRAGIRPHQTSLCCFSSLSLPSVH